MASAKVIPLRPDPRAAELEGATPRAPRSPADLEGLARRAPLSPAALRDLLEALSGDRALRVLAERLARPLGMHGPEDLMQSTLERVLRGVASFRGTGELMAWVQRIMRNAQIEILRREAAERGKRAALAAEPRADREAGVDERVGRWQRRALAVEAWRRLKRDADVRLFWERAYLGRSVEQIVRRSGRPRSTVYLMLKRGGSKLVREFERLAQERVR